MAVYLDTAALIALYEPRDKNHEPAKRRLQMLAEANEILVCGRHTVVEFVDGLVHRYGQARAVEELDRLRRSPRLRIEETHPHHERALEIFRGHPDWDVDLSDALSFALMRGIRLETAFSYDRDFEKAGFTVVG